MARQIRSGDLDENDVENADETHFVANGRTLGFSGEEEVKYADVVWGGECMTMVSLCGRRDARIEPTFMVFKNRYDPIRYGVHRTTSREFPIDRDRRSG